MPYISKVTGVPMVDLATRCMFGEKLKDMGYGTGLYKESDYYAVKVPVFSFQKLRDLDTQLGPEMKSTGEVLGVSKSFKEALFKGLVGAGYKMQKKTGAVVILSVLRINKKLFLLQAVLKLLDMSFMQQVVLQTHLTVTWLLLIWFIMHQSQINTLIFWI